MSRKTDIEIEEGSTNVYADLGYADAAEMQRKSQLAAEIARAIKARRLTQQGAAELLGVDQSKVSRITRGQFRGVSEAKLLELVAKLGHDVKIVVGTVRRRTGRIDRGRLGKLDHASDFRIAEAAAIVRRQLS